MTQSRHKLVPWVSQALVKLGGSAPIMQIAREIWEAHSDEITADDNLFYQWHYDMRWAGEILSKAGKIDRNSTRGVWKII